MTGSRCIRQHPPQRVGVTMAALGETINVFGGRDAEHNELFPFLL
jgi:hypothetical protein